MTTYQQRLEAEMAALFASGASFLVVDTETTGLLDDPESQVIEIAAINQRGEVVFASLIKPDVPISPAASALHGISEADVATAPHISQIVGHLFNLITSVERVYCYNVKFDLAMLRRTVQHYGYTLPPQIGTSQPWECMMTRYATYHGEVGRYGNYKWQKLSTACAALGVPMSEAHRATGDALNTLSLMRALASRGGPEVMPGSVFPRGETIWPENTAKTAFDVLQEHAQQATEE